MSLSLSASFAFVPLFQMYCASSGSGGTTKVHKSYAPPVDPNSEAAKRLITINFTSDVNPSLHWDFKAEVPRVVVAPGETSLIFYKAKNLTNKPIIGMSIYNVAPPEVGYYFNKIQCFCFEEQMLSPGEEIEMPIFFFLDPELLKDSRLDSVRDVTLSYTFFEAGSDIPPEYKEMMDMYGQNPHPYVAPPRAKDDGEVVQQVVAV